MKTVISTLRTLLGRPTKQDLWNAYYTAKIKKDYRRMRYYFNEIVKFNNDLNYNELRRRYDLAVNRGDSRTASKYYLKIQILTKNLNG